MANESPACPRSRWGKTELSIPVIPFGTQGFGDNFGPVTEEEAKALIRHAIDLGVNHFDCARCYGNSLRKLGIAIKDGIARRDEIIISGRVCCHSAAEWGGYGKGRPNYSKARVLEDVEDQLEILGIESFDVLFLHDPPEIEPTLQAGGALEGLEEARARGWVDFLGYGMNPHDFHLTAIESGRIECFLCFSDYNVLRQSAAEQVLPAANERDIGVMNGWSIMRGWLTGTPLEQITPRNDWNEDQQRAERMRLWCEDRGLDMLALALQFCLRETRIHGHPIGSLNTEQLETNIAAASSDVPDAVIEEFVAAEL